MVPLRFTTKGSASYFEKPPYTNFQQRTRCSAEEARHCIVPGQGLAAEAEGESSGSRSAMFDRSEAGGNHWLTWSSIWALLNFRSLLGGRRAMLPYVSYRHYEGGRLLSCWCNRQGTTPRSNPSWFPLRGPKPWFIPTFLAEQQQENESLADRSIFHLFYMQ